jgi:hypothetical protein
MSSTSVSSPFRETHDRHNILHIRGELMQGRFGLFREMRL